ncbi:hypothetical protein AB8Y46_15575, partial [Listeria monocytogenes]
HIKLIEDENLLDCELMKEREDE